MFIPDPDCSPSRILGSKNHRIRDPDHWCWVLFSKMPSLLLRWAAVEKEQADPSKQHGPTQFRHGRLQTQISGAYTDKKKLKYTVICLCLHFPVNIYITIYAPMIYTASCVMFLVRADTLGRWGSGRVGLMLEISSLWAPVKWPQPIGECRLGPKKLAFRTAYL